MKMVYIKISYLLLLLTVYVVLTTGCFESSDSERRIRDYKKVIESLKTDNPQWSGNYSIYFSEQGYPIGLDLTNSVISHESDVTTVDILPSSLKDISALNKINITKLNLSNTMIDDLSPIADQPLKYLDITSTPISSIEELSKMPLSQLLMSDTNVGDLLPLRGLPLSTLLMRRTKVNDLSPLIGMELRFLDISETEAANKPLPKGIIVKHISRLNSQPDPSPEPTPNNSE